MLTTLQAERIKLTSVKSPWWSALLVVVLGLGFAAIMGQSAKSATNSDGTPAFQITNVDAVSGVAQFGVLVMMILAVLTVTSEYRFGTIRTTFQTQPDRPKVFVAKALLVGVAAAVLTTVLGYVGFWIAKALAGERAGLGLQLSTESQWRTIYSIGFFAFFAVVLAMGVGTLVRQTAGAVSIVLLWPLVVESLVGIIPKVGDKVKPFLPFENISQFLGGQSLTEFHWGPWVSMLYFAAFALIIFGVSLVVANRRDA